jgi:hypothetical protein
MTVYQPLHCLLFLFTPAKMKHEDYVQALLCNYLRTNYPEAIFTSDLSGVRLPIGLAKKVKPLKSSRGIPDLIILKPQAGYYGLMLECKATTETVLRKDGGQRADQHLKEQIEIIMRLRQLGYAAFFVNGFAAGRECLTNYMNGTLPVSAPPLEYVETAPRLKFV